MAPIKTVTVYAASSALVDGSYVEAGRQLGRLIAEQGWVQVNGGGASGLMGAVTDGGVGAGVDPEWGCMRSPCPVYPPCLWFSGLATGFCLLGAFIVSLVPSHLKHTIPTLLRRMLEQEKGRADPTPLPSPNSPGSVWGQK